MAGIYQDIQYSKSLDRSVDRPQNGLFIRDIGLIKRSPAASRCAEPGSVCAGSRKSAMTTVAPADVKRCAMAAPMPEDPR